MKRRILIDTARNIRLICYNMILGNMRADGFIPVFGGIIKAQINRKAGDNDQCNQNK